MTPLFPSWRPAFEYVGVRWTVQVGERRHILPRLAVQLEFAWPVPAKCRKNARTEFHNLRWAEFLKHEGVTAEFVAANIGKLSRAKDYVRRNYQKWFIPESVLLSSRRAHVIGWGEE